MSMGIYKWGIGDGSENVAFWGWIGNGPVVFPKNAFVPSIVKDSNRIKIVI